MSISPLPSVSISFRAAASSPSESDSPRFSPSPASSLASIVPPLSTSTAWNAARARSLGLGGTEDGANLFATIDDEQDSEDEFDAAAAASEIFNDLMAASMGGSKEVLGLSLGMFTPDNGFRVAVSKIVFHPVTEVSIVASIVINVVALLFQQPGADQIELVSRINFFCGLIFTVEMVLR
eukprot:COSAG03_NODE_12137_length_559_cov_1.415217_1_plen_179_part_10